MEKPRFVEVMRAVLEATMIAASMGIHLASFHPSRVHFYRSQLVTFIEAAPRCRVV